jgi:hypothetical protein
LDFVEGVAAIYLDATIPAHWNALPLAAFAMSTDELELGLVLHMHASFGLCDVSLSSGLDIVGFEALLHVMASSALSATMHPVCRHRRRIAMHGG